MIAINWFEVFLQSTVHSVFFQRADDRSSLEDLRRSVPYRTILRSYDGVHTLYHLTPSPIHGVEMGEIDLSHDPPAGKYAIELGFGDRLREAGFQVRFRHVGGVSFQLLDVTRSARPQIYRSLEGIRFRCFYGIDWGDSTRWGLVLRYVTSQCFNISLAESRLRALAIGARVIPFEFGSVEDEEFASADRGSKILVDVDGDRGVLVDREGVSHISPLAELTLPCNRMNLLNYIRQVEGDASASRVSTQIQQDSLALTSENKINTSLAKDQVEALTEILTNNRLTMFRLPLPDQPVVRVSQDPLVMGKSNQ